MKVAIASIDPESVEHMIHLLIDAEHSDRIVKPRIIGLDGIAALVGQELPDLLIVDQLCKTAEDILALAPIAKKFPGISFILLGNGMVAEALMHALHIGVKDVLSLPYTDEQFLAAVKRIEQTRSIGTLSPKKAHISAFLSCKGGGGSTFIAANIAFLLAAEYGQRTLLVDLDLTSGDASLFVSQLPGTTTLADLAKNINRLDDELLTASTIHVLGNFDVLEAPDSTELALAVKPEQVDALLNLASHTYDQIILNLGHTFDAVSVGALDRSDDVFAIVQLTIPFLRDAKRVCATLMALGLDPNRTHVVVNRYEHSSDILIEDVERAVGLKVGAIVPNDYRSVATSINRGIPIATSHRRGLIARRLRSLIEQHLGLPQPTPKGWLRNLIANS